jgi:hypothetical protein
MIPLYRDNDPEEILGVTNIMSRIITDNKNELFIKYESDYKYAITIPKSHKFNENSINKKLQELFEDRMNITCISDL